MTTEKLTAGKTATRRAGVTETRVVLNLTIEQAKDLLGLFHEYGIANPNNNCICAKLAGRIDKTINKKKNIVEMPDNDALAEFAEERAIEDCSVRYE